jgi:hypothetical protein
VFVWKWPEFAQRWVEIVLGDAPLDKRARAIIVLAGNMPAIFIDDDFAFLMTSAKIAVAIPRDLQVAGDVLSVAFCIVPGIPSDHT